MEVFLRALQADSRFFSTTVSSSVPERMVSRPLDALLAYSGRVDVKIQDWSVVVKHHSQPGYETLETPRRAGGVLEEEGRRRGAVADRSSTR